MLAIENVNSSPIKWVDTAGGYALSYNSSTHPRALDPTNLTSRDLNVQIYAAEYDPWYNGTMGLAGYTDAAQTTAAANYSSIRNTIVGFGPSA